MLVKLLLIAGIVMMVFESGFWDEVDNSINRRFKFCHLPKLFTCQFCQTFWVSLIYLFIFYGFSVLNVFLALLNANVGELLLPLFKLIKEAFMRLIERIIDKVI